MGAQAWNLVDPGRWQDLPGFGKRKAKCRHLVIDSGKYFKILPDDKGKITKIVRYRYFAEGNALAKR